MTPVGDIKKICVQEYTVAVITHDESAAVFSQKGESLKDYWGCLGVAEG